MARKSLIERENRTTITGIIAIVLIVFLIASFMRVNEVGWFDGGDALTGMATNAESFVGVRYVELDVNEAYVGHLSIGGLGERSYYVYADDGILIVDYGDNYVQTVLVEDPDIAGLYRGVYDDQSTTSVLFNTQSMQLYVENLAAVPLPPISLTPIRIFDGSVSVAGKPYYFILLGEELVIQTDDTRDSIFLQERPDDYYGVWDGRDVIVDPTERRIVIHEFY